MARHSTYGKGGLLAVHYRAGRREGKGITMFNNNNDDDNINNFKFDEPSIKALERIGVRPVGIFLPSNATALPWSKVYHDPEFRWSETNLVTEQDRYSFTNAATMLGPTHIRDVKTGQYLNLNALDTDCEKVRNRLGIQIRQILDLSSWDWVTDKLRDLVREFLQSTGIFDVDHNLTLLDIFKKLTFVTKTRKIYGHHIYWLSQKQKRAIGTANCRPGHEFEIKTDNSLGLCTLPGSAHKEDPNFRYAAVGVTDRILANDVLYDLFVEMFQDCMSNRSLDKVPIHQGTEEMQQDAIQQKRQQEQENKVQAGYSRQMDKRVFDLSLPTISATIGLLSTFVVDDHKHDFHMRLSGMLFHSRISIKSSDEIIGGICTRSNDQDPKDRRRLLIDTYQRGFGKKDAKKTKDKSIDEDNESRILGAPALVELIAGTLSDETLDGVTDVIQSVKDLWQRDIKRQKKIIQEEEDKILHEVTIFEAKRMQRGWVRTTGSIIGMSPIYNMVTNLRWRCLECLTINGSAIPNDIPHYKDPTRNSSKCVNCGEKKLSPEYDYVPTIDVELQDPDTFDDLTRMWIKLFNNDTTDVRINEVVSIQGRLHVIRRNDNPNNRAETVLFADDEGIEYAEKHELKLSQPNIEKIQQWQSDIQKQGKNPIDELVSMISPEYIEMDFLKKSVLLACANAGLKNVEHAVPERQRINVFVIGPPGLAKTDIIEDTTSMVPSARFVGGQNATGLSLTAHISKEEGDNMYILRSGPIPRAKGSICIVDEFGYLKAWDQQHFLDCMDRDYFYVVKHGHDVRVQANTSIIASSNPIGGTWKYPDRIDSSEIPVSLPILDRFDIVIILRENKDASYLKKITEGKWLSTKKYEAGEYEGNKEFLQQYIAYARTFKPVFSELAYKMLSLYFVNIGKTSIDGLQRKFDTILRIALAITRLKLKQVVGEAEAKETMAFYNAMLNNYKQVTAAVAESPRDIGVNLLKMILQQHGTIPLTMSEIATKMCERNDQLAEYLGIDFRLSHNHKLRDIYETTILDKNVEIVNENPMALRWRLTG